MIVVDPCPGLLDWPAAHLATDNLLMTTCCWVEASLVTETNKHHTVTKTALAHLLQNYELFVSIEKQYVMEVQLQ